MCDFFTNFAKAKPLFLREAYITIKSYGNL